MFAQFRFYITGAVLILIVALGAAVYVQHARNKNLSTELNQAQDANRTNDAAIKDLIAEREQSGRTCESRLSAKDDLIRRMQSIDALASNKGGKHETNNNRSVDLGGTLLGALNGMYPAVHSQDGVCPAAGLADAGGAGLVSRKIYYCFCSDDDVRNLLKNYELEKGDRADLRTILDSLR